MAARRITTILGHLSKTRGVRGYSTSATPGGHYVPQYSNVDHPVLKTRRRVNVLESYMSYLDTGVGDNVVVFLHGNPTSSYLWRNVILEVMGTARCIAPDLIGHGLSGGEPNNQYRVADHYKYLDAFLSTLDLPERFTLVVHDWGAGVGLHWANRHRHRIQGLVYMEAAMGVAKSWGIMSEMQQSVYKMLRSPQADDFMANPTNVIVEGLSRSIQRTLTPEEELMWKARFESPGEARRPIVTWCREVPIRGDGPDDVIKIFDDVRDWLSSDRGIPKLYVHVTPGMLAPSNKAMTRNWHKQKVVHAKGLHFAQEDDPVTIGKEIATFLKEDVYK